MPEICILDKHEREIEIEMPDDNLAVQQEVRFDRLNAPEPKANGDETRTDGLDISNAEEASPWRRGDTISFMQ